MKENNTYLFIQLQRMYEPRMHVGFRSSERRDFVAGVWVFDHLEVFWSFRGH